MTNETRREMVVRYCFNAHQLSCDGCPLLVVKKYCVDNGSSLPENDPILLEIKSWAEEHPRKDGDVYGGY